MKIKLALFLIAILLLTGCSGYEAPVALDTQPAPSESSETKPSASSGPSDEERVVHLWLFYNPTCPHCHKERGFLAQIRPKYPNLIVSEFDVSSGQQNSTLYYQMATAYKTQTAGVPMTYIGDKVFKGYSPQIGAEMENYIQYCLENDCPKPGSRISTN